MTKEQGIKHELRCLMDELTGAIFGTSNTRPQASICADIHKLGTSPEGRAVGYQRPYAWLEAWRAFALSGPSDAEQERRKLADAGWVTDSKDDTRRREMQRKAEEARREFEALRDKRLAEESASATQRIITRKALANVVGPSR